MAYIAQSDVVSEFKELTVSSSSAITPAKIAAFISEEEAILNGEVGTIYVVPIASTASSSFLVMQMMSKLLVKARILDQLFVKSGNPDVDQGNPADELRARVLDKDTGMLSRIKNRMLLLEDATLKEASAGVKSYNNSNSQSPVFRKGVNQW